MGSLMMIAAPVPFKEALDAQAVKVLLPTTLRSDMLSELPAALRERSLFSAGVTSSELLQHVDDGLKDILSGKKTEEGVKSELARLGDLAHQCWMLFNLRGWARVDFRVDAAGEPWILEVSANPCISPDAGFAAALERASIPFEEGVRRILEDVS